MSSTSSRRTKGGCRGISGTESVDADSVRQRSVFQRSSLRLRGTLGNGSGGQRSSLLFVGPRGAAYEIHLSVDAHLALRVKIFVRGDWEIPITPDGRYPDGRYPHDRFPHGRFPTRLPDAWPRFTFAGGRLPPPHPSDARSACLVSCASSRQSRLVCRPMWLSLRRSSSAPDCPWGDSVG